MVMFMRTKKAFLNLITDVIPLILVAIIGIFKLKIFIQVLGDETLGLYQLFSQIMIYVALVDGGLATAVLYSLYKPNAAGDKNLVSSILSAAHKTFSKIGILVFSIAAVVAFFVPFFIKGSTFDYSYIVYTFILFSLSSVINYFFVPYSALLEVREKKYVVNLVSSIGQIVKGLLEIGLVLAGFSFPVLLVMYSAIALISSLFTMILCKKCCPGYSFNSKKLDYSYKKHLGPLIFHKINGLVSFNIDVIIISKFLGLKFVAIYSVYNYIVNMLKQILGKITTSIMAILGNCMAEKKGNLKSLYLEFNSMLFFLGTVICVPLFFAINGFIDIWYEGEVQTTWLLAFAFSSYLYFFLIKSCSATFVQSAGLFKETQYCALTDTIVNLVLSLVLIHLIGISGVVIATSVSVFIAEYILKTIVLYKNVFHERSISYFAGNIKFFILTFIDIVVGYYLFNFIDVNGLGMWFLVYGLYAVINAVIILGIYYMMKEATFINRLKIMFKK